MTTNLRREPPPFRTVSVRNKDHLSPRMIRVTLGGSELAGLEIGEPAASVRLLLPSPGASRLVIPEWNGNEFLLGDGSRPLIRTFTPRHLDAHKNEIDIDMVVHADGHASHWAKQAAMGDSAAVSGPGRGYKVDPEAPAFLLAGDESAIPAISQLLETIPQHLPVDVHIEITSADARIELPHHAMARVSWHINNTGIPGAELVAAVGVATIGSEVRVWCAGEAAAMHQIRTNLFKERGLPRPQATVRGYWKLTR